jgi:FkbM family methyltransferase
MSNTLFRGTALDRCIEVARLAVKSALFFAVCLGDVKQYMRLRRRIVFFIHHLGLYERREMAFMRKTLKPGQCAIDVGASFGVYAAAMAQAVGPTGRVLAFEPLPQIFEALTDEMRRFPQVELRNVGMSDGSSSTAELRIPKIFGKMPEPALASIEPQPMKYTSTAVSLTSLDEISGDLTRLDFIKVDIEGHERRFFNGALQTIRRFRPLVQFEESDPGKGLGFYIDLAESLDYLVCKLDGTGKLQALTAEKGSSKKGNHLGWNFYLLPREHAATA